MPVRKARSCGCESRSMFSFVRVGNGAGSRWEELRRQVGSAAAGHHPLIAANQSDRWGDWVADDSTRPILDLLRGAAIGQGGDGVRRGWRQGGKG